MHIRLYTITQICEELIDRVRKKKFLISFLIFYNNYILLRIKLPQVGITNACIERKKHPFNMIETPSPQENSVSPF